MILDLDVFVHEPPFFVEPDCVSITKRIYAANWTSDKCVCVISIFFFNSLDSPTSVFLPEPMLP